MVSLKYTIRPHVNSSACLSTVQRLAVVSPGICHQSKVNIFVTKFIFYCDIYHIVKEPLPSVTLCPTTALTFT